MSVNMYLINFNWFFFCIYVLRCVCDQTKKYEYCANYWKVFHFGGYLIWLWIITRLHLWIFWRFSKKILKFRIIFLFGFWLWLLLWFLLLCKVKVNYHEYISHYVFIMEHLFYFKKCKHQIASENKINKYNYFFSWNQWRRNGKSLSNLSSSK